jgi:hypothetical protein
MNDIPAALRRVVLQRSAGRCEYCQLSQAGQEATFHIDHIIPRAAGGLTVADNLALACVSCSLRKGARQCVPDPLTGEECPLFHPRQHRWLDHFRWNGVIVEGVTSLGRATVEALAMNRPLMVAIREEEQKLGRHPPRPEAGNGHLG